MALDHATAGDIVDLSPLGAGLRTTRTHAITKTDQFEAIRLIVPAGKEIPAHEVSGSLTLQCLEGRAVIGLAGSEVEIKAGQWLYLDGGESHTVRGIEDASLLLTIFFDRA